MDFHSLIQILTPLSMILTIFIGLITLVNFFKQPGSIKTLISVIALVIILLAFQHVLFLCHTIYRFVIYITAGFSIAFFLLHRYKFADFHLSDEEVYIFWSMVGCLIVNASMNTFYSLTNWSLFATYYPDLQKYVATLSIMKFSITMYQFML